jgi:hypothetical protein
MNREFASSRCRRTIALTLLVLLTGLPYSGPAQRTDSRPIEFSEPRENKSTRTNSGEFGSERRRLSDLEDRLSKTFDFFQFEDSLSGSPAFTTPRRTVVSPKNPKTSVKPSKAEDWLTANPLDEDLPAELFSADRFSELAAPDQQQDRSTLLDSLRGEDWLVRGTMGATFWEIPVVQTKAANEQVPWDSFGQRPVAQKERGADEDFESRLQNFLSRTSGAESRFELPDRKFPTARNLEPFAPDQTFRRGGLDQRREEYRDLVGLNTKPASIPAPAGSGLYGGSQTGPGTYPSYLQASRPASTATTLTGSSLHPVRSSERESLYPGSPYAPQRPSVLDTLDIEPQATPSVAPENRVSSPFYQPPRRQF